MNKDSFVTYSRVFNNKTDILNVFTSFKKFWLCRVKTVAMLASFATIIFIVVIIVGSSNGSRVDIPRVRRAAPYITYIIVIITRTFVRLPSRLSHGILVAGVRANHLKTVSTTTNRRWTNRNYDGSKARARFATTVFTKRYDDARAVFIGCNTRVIKNLIFIRLLPRTQTCFDRAILPALSVHRLRVCFFFKLIFVFEL